MGDRKHNNEYDRYYSQASLNLSLHDICEAKKITPKVSLNHLHKREIVIHKHFFWWVKWLEMLTQT